jgi:hypothetical protein
MVTGNRDSPKQRRFRWWLIPLLLVPFAAGALILWLRKPLPPPVVSLSLVGFKVNQTNTYAVMSLSNLGPTRIYFDGQSWEAEIETGDGLQTTQGQNFTINTLGTRQHSNVTFAVKMPSNPICWRVTSTDTFDHHRNPRLEIIEWLNRSWSPRAFEILKPAITILPMPSGDSGEITTPWLTNLPPAAVLSEETSVESDADPNGDQR